MIKKEVINRDDAHPKYANLRVHQTILSNLKVDDLVILTINGTEYFRCKVIHGSSAHVNISLQDKGKKLIELTEEQKTEAINQYRIHLGV